MIQNEKLAEQQEIAITQTKLIYEDKISKLKQGQFKEIQDDSFFVKIKNAQSVQDNSSDALKEAYRALQNRVNDYSQMLEAKDKELLAKELLLSGKNQEIEELKKRLAKHLQELEANNSILAGKNQEIEDLNKGLNKLTEDFVKFYFYNLNLNIIKDYATKQLQELDEHLINCDDIIHGLGAENEALQKALKQTPDTMNYQSLLQKLRDYEAQSDKQNAEITYLNKLKPLTVEYEIKIERLIEEINQLKNNNSKYFDDQFMEAEEQCSILLNENNKMRDDLIKCDEFIANLENQNNNLNNQILNLANENKNLKNHSVDNKKSTGAPLIEVIKLL